MILQQGKIPDTFLIPYALCCMCHVFTNTVNPVISPPFFGKKVDKSPQPPSLLSPPSPPPYYYPLINEGVSFKIEVVGPGCKENFFTACHSGKLKLAFTSLAVISTSPKSFLTTRIDFTLFLLFGFLKKHHLPVGQVKNRIH